jgi:hypothetical protein
MKQIWYELWQTNQRMINDKNPFMLDEGVLLHLKIEFRNGAYGN